MKNINKIRLAGTIFKNIANTAKLITPFPEIAKVINDFPRDLNIVGIQISATVMDETAGTGTYTVRLALGMTDSYNVNTNWWEWALQVVKSAAFVQATPTQINQTIGNFKDTIFVLRKFMGETIGGQADKGEIHLVGQAETGASAPSGGPSASVDVVIYLYYK